MAIISYTILEKRRARREGARIVARSCISATPDSASGKVKVCFGAHPDRPCDASLYARGNAHLGAQGQMKKNRSQWSWKRGLILFCIVSVFIGFTACRGPERKVTDHMNELRLQWDSNLVYQANLPGRIIDWNEAVGIMLA